MPACEHYQTTKKQKSLHSILVPPQVCSQIGINKLGQLKEIDGYKYVVTAVVYIVYIGRAFKRKNTGEIIAKFLYKLLCQY